MPLTKFTKKYITNIKTREPFININRLDSHQQPSLIPVIYQFLSVF